MLSENRVSLNLSFELKATSHEVPSEYAFAFSLEVPCIIKMTLMNDLGCVGFDISFGYTRASL